MALSVTRDLMSEIINKTTTTMSGVFRCAAKLIRVTYVHRFLFYSLFFFFFFFFVMIQNNTIVYFFHNNNDNRTNAATTTINKNTLPVVIQDMKRTM